MPRAPVPCPNCSARAITDSDGNDYVHAFFDHVRNEDDIHRKWQHTGTVARLRICSQCGHVWATLVKPVEK